jgi:hypothetical protein
MVVSHTFKHQILPKSVLYYCMVLILQIIDGVTTEEIMCSNSEGDALEDHHAYGNGSDIKESRAATLFAKEC